MILKDLIFENIVCSAMHRKSLNALTLFDFLSDLALMEITFRCVLS